MTVAAGRAAPHAGLLCAGLAAAVMLRVGLAGAAGPRSAPAGAVFGGALLALAVASGWRPGRLPAVGAALRPLAAGLGGAAVLLSVPLALHLASPVRLAPAGGGFALWASVVSLVAVAEEALLRGALMHVLMRRGLHPEVAVAVAALAFAALHVPVYGWVAVPLDVAVGVWLGGLRLASGGAGAPAVAHTVADLATWWLR